MASANSPEQRVMYAATTNTAATKKTTRFSVAGHRCGDTIAHLLSLLKHKLACHIFHLQVVYEKLQCFVNGTHLPNSTIAIE